MASKKQIFDRFCKTRELDYGAKFHRVDLHFHTPASEDARGSNRYKFNPYKGKYPKKRTASNYQTKVKEAQRAILKKSTSIAAAMVKRFLKEGLSIVAVTDHNGIGTIWADSEAESMMMDLTAPTWYEIIDDEAQKINEKEDKTVLTILPGVEISTDGLHVLAIFPPQNPRRKVHFMICDLLNEVGLAIDEWGENPRAGKASVFDTIEIITKKGGIPIPAHIDGKDQAMLRHYYFKVNSDPMKDILMNENLSAVEIVEPSRFIKKDAKLKMPLKQWMDTLRVDSGLAPLTYLQGSDAHAIPAIAKRYTNIKMCAPDFDGLETAIIMPSSRIRIAYKAGLEVSGMFVHSVVIDDPFFGKEQFRFNRHLNCVTSRKEGGKSRLFELIRSAVTPTCDGVEGEVTVYVEKVEGKKSKFYAFNRKGESGGVDLYKVGTSASSTSKQSTKSAAAMGVQPRFYIPEEIENIISSKKELNGFLVRHYGKPSTASVKRFNELFTIPGFLKKHDDPLLKLEKVKSEYKLTFNTAWHKNKTKMCDFFSLSQSMRRTALMCMIIITDDFGPTIVDAPEAHFDNEDIANYLVPVIRKYKDTQQVILFTSNPLLAVNTDPDNYVLVQTRAPKDEKIMAGFAIDDRERGLKVTNIMEGNLDSFRKRAVRYGSAS
jgi:predicted metal-dependent phosphoesterase TrpH